MAVAAAPEVGFSKTYLDSLSELQGVEALRVNDAVRRLIDDPNHPSLNLHPLHGDRRGRLYTIRASDDLRVLLAKEGNVYVVLEAGHHDDVYERADRLQFAVNPHTGFIGLVGGPVSDDGGDARKDKAEPLVAGPRPLDHWADAELLEAGCPPEDVPLIRACRDEDELCRLPAHLFEIVFENMDLTPEQWRSPALDADAEAEARLRDSLESFGALAGFTRLLGAEQAKLVVDAPIEDWMIFLHPQQRTAVLRRYDGPARIRGSAGTGKTVVGPHRAAELARRYRGEGQVLFTTFINSLPPVLAHLYERLPGVAPGEVEFCNVDKLASELCRDAGQRVVVELAAVDAAFASAWRQAVTAGSPIAVARLTRDYVREEITAVIKGRGITSLDEYLAIERTGRRTRMTASVREAVWALRDAWDQQMAARGTVDFADRLHVARDLAREQPSRYRAAVVDEAQDITLVGLQFVRALVNGVEGSDRPDGLLILGDGAQRIYPGGFTLRQAGLEVRGRTTVLKVNYRNTREVIEAAMAVTGGGAVDDLGDEYRRGDEQAEARRDGAKPRLVLATDHDAELRYVADRIGDLVGETGDYGDLAVAVATNKQATSVAEALRTAGIPVQPLEQYTGLPTPAVKVGTHHRVKGLEFKTVFLPFLSAKDFPRSQLKGQADDEYAEYRDRSLGQLFVAMTRARDQLYLLTSGDPTDAVANALERFEVVDA